MSGTSILRRVDGCDVTNAADVDIDNVRSNVDAEKGFGAASTLRQNILRKDKKT
jgi:hypothetical protein